MSNLITTTPADQYLPERRTVEAFSKSPLSVGSEFDHPESATVRVVEGYPAYLRPYADRPTTVNVMVSGHTYDTETETPIRTTVHTEFTPEQAEALAHVLIIYAADARATEAALLNPTEEV